jgi:hypothetical protein
MRVMLDTNIILRNVHLIDPQHELVYRSLDTLIVQGWDLCIGDQNNLRVLGRRHSSEDRQWAEPRAGSNPR